MISAGLRLLALFQVLTLSGLLAGCGGGDGTGGNTPPPPPPPPLPFGANFSEIQASVFTPICTACHAGAGAPQGLRLDDANSYAMLVSVASAEVPALFRVSPGDPDNSYVIQKLEGTAAVGSQMPQGGPFLSQATIDVIRQWITDGAIDDRLPGAGPIHVTSLAPLPDSILDSAPSEIRAIFSRELDVSTVNANTFVLEASGGDMTFGDGNEVVIAAASITAPGANPMSAVFDLTGAALADDTYRVRLLGDGPSIIMDLDANALDGEFAAAFPSGDGSAGGDFEATFGIVTPAPQTLDDIQASTFTPICSGCHSGPTSTILPSGMDLSDADASFASLVGVASLEVPAVVRAAAGDPDNSYLIQKLEGTAAVGQRMPLGGPFLPQIDIDGIRQWITDGAQR